ncbi:hypothetical protein K493DRAFT_312504 [Basidiobolus meristosporus CBS 931.73]|uniref:Uncharacterized protein n=1 Tax=Basidiobolus meristosporus CBS 931.73 TaxID=1314790 RepID=A0A1Y1YTB2_9FUNG|nr:hypothetical protein K493DRAFT_312504 [Basidiobolus meristosporus CBS 931.73]|eukprot:ORY01216.1 hypothetical protein K493DRAFT_312504 [Basidiobolus meristosporus CBS 931.73]
MLSVAIKQSFGNVRSFSTTALNNTPHLVQVESSIKGGSFLVSRRLAERLQYQYTPYYDFLKAVVFKGFKQEIVNRRELPNDFREFHSFDIEIEGENVTGAALSHRELNKVAKSLLQQRQIEKAVTDRFYEIVKQSTAGGVVFPGANNLHKMVDFKFFLEEDIRSRARREFNRIKWRDSRKNVLKMDDLVQQIRKAEMNLDLRNMKKNAIIVKADDIDMEELVETLALKILESTGDQDPLEH